MRCATHILSAAPHSVAFDLRVCTRDPVPGQGEAFTCNPDDLMVFAQMQEDVSTTCHSPCITHVNNQNSKPAIFDMHYHDACILPHSSLKGPLPVLVSDASHIHFGPNPWLPDGLDLGWKYTRHSNKVEDVENSWVKAYKKYGKGLVTASLNQSVFPEWVTSLSSERGWMQFLPMLWFCFCITLVGMKWNTVCHT